MKRARDPRHQRAVERLHDQQRQERGREQPRQVPHATGNAHLVTQRAQHGVGAEQREEIAERP